MPYSVSAGLSKLWDDSANNRTRVRLYLNVNAQESYFIGYGTDAYLHIDVGGGANIEGMTSWTPYSIARPTQTSLNGNYTTTTIWSGDYWLNHSSTGYASYRVYGSYESWGTYGTPTLGFDTGWTTSGLSDYVFVPGTPSAGVSRGGDGTSMTVTSSIPSSAATITDYNYRWSTDNASWSGATAMGTGRSAVFTGTATQDYYFQTRAYSSEGWGGWSGSVGVQGVPTAPTSVVGTASSSVSGRINVSWTAPSDTNGGITNYYVYRDDTYVGQTGNATTSYADDGLVRGTSYTYKVRAYNAIGYGAQSSASTATQAPGVPYAPVLDTAVASTDTFGKVTLDWTKPTTPVGTISDYYLYADGVVVASVSGEDTTVGAITGLNPRQTYSFTVRARNAFAVSNGLTGETSNAISRKAPGAPTAPTSLVSEAPFSPPGTIDLDWIAPTDVGTEGGTITGYNIYLAGSSTPVLSTVGTGTSVTIEDLIPATTYTFNVRARNEIADIVGTFSAASNSTTATAQGEPEAPTNLTVVSDPLVAGRLILTWTPPVGYNTGFRVYTGSDVLVANVSTPRLEIDGLTTNTSYSYKVRARNPLTDLTGSPGGPASSTVSGLVGSSSTQTVPSISVTNNTNTTLAGTFNLVSTTPTSMSYSKTASNISFASVPAGGGSTVNNTNTTLNGTYVIATPTSTSVTYSETVSDIPLNTSTPSGTMLNNTNVIFNGSYEVAASPAPDPVAKTVSYSKTTPNISSRTAGGSVTNNSNAVYNGEYIISDVTETTITYPKTNSNIPESDAFGMVYNKTNTDIFNGTFVVTDTPDHKTVEYSTGDLVYGENLITNPSFETIQTGSTTLRTNLVVNPAFESNVSSWTTTDSSLARSTAYAYAGSHSGLVSPSANSGSISISSTTVSGQVYTFSAWLYAEDATTVRANVTSPAITGTTTAIPADTWTRITVSFTANGTSSVCLIQSVGSTQAFYVDAVLLEQTSELRPYFDGATTDALGWDYGWTGTANASTSTAKALTTTRTNLMTNPSLEVSGAYGGNEITIVANSTEDFYVGTKSWKFTTTGGVASDFRTPVSSIAGSTTYTASMWIKATAGRVIKLKVQTWTTGYGRFDTQLSSDFTMTGAWQRLSYTWTTASDIVGAELGFAIDSSFASTVGYIDALMVEASSYAGVYFDGSTAGASWTGSANASTSTLVGTRAIPVGLTGVSAGIVSTYERAHSGSVSALVSPAANTGGASLTQTTVAGTVYTFSAWVYADSAKNMKLSADSTVGSTVAVPATTWTRLSLSFTAEDTSTLLSVLGTDSTTAFYLDDVMLEASSDLSDYFDGDTDATSTTWPAVYSWVGTPHASISTREVGGTLPEVGSEILNPFGQAARIESEAQLQIRYRSGWLG